MLSDASAVDSFANVTASALRLASHERTRCQNETGPDTDGLPAEDVRARVTAAGAARFADGFVELDVLPPDAIAASLRISRSLRCSTLSRFIMSRVCFVNAASWRCCCASAA